MESQSNERHYTFITILNMTTNAMVEELISRMIAAGYDDVRPADHQVFENLDRNGTRITELASRTQMTHQSMSELVVALEKRGYVERQTDPSDRRARLVRLTQKGRQLLRQSLTEIAKIEAEWLRRMQLNHGHDVRAVLEQALRTAGRRTDSQE